MEEIIRLINDYWKFDNDQQHLSTWHDKQDLLEAIRQAKIWDKPAVIGRSVPLVCGNPDHNGRMQTDGYCDWCGDDIWRK